MKKTLLVFLFFLLSFSSFGQKIRFSDSTNIWTCFLLGLGLEPPIVDSYSFEYIGKAVIRDTIYNRFCTNGIGESSVYIREDTILQKVFIIDSTTDTNEHILYDYTLQIGDTFKYTNTVSHYVGSIDSVLINSMWYRTWHLFPSVTDTDIMGEIQDDYYVIEGIGGTAWPLFPISPTTFESGYVLTCFSNKGTTPPLSQKVGSIFDNSSSCGLNFGLGIKSISKGDLNIFPNPAATFIDITSTSTITQLTITNLLGQTIYSNQYNAELVQVDVSAFSVGVYFVKVNGVDVRKFVKE